MISPRERQCSLWCSDGPEASGGTSSCRGSPLDHLWGAGGRTTLAARAAEPRRGNVTTSRGARFNPVPRPTNASAKTSKPPRLAFVAVARNLLVALNAIARDRTAWQH